MTEFTPTPLSEFHPRASLREFIDQLLYADEPGRFERFAGDHLLLDALDERLRLEHFRGGRRPDEGPLPSVGELDEQAVRTAVRKIEGDRFGRWKLTGDDKQPIFERLDQHFAEQQAAWAAHRRDQTEQAAHRAKQSAELDRQLGVQRERQERGLWGLPNA